MRRPMTLLATLVLALALGACGHKEAEALHGSNEGAYLDLNGMKYQVQISRVLNPNSPEDRAYLIGVDSSQRTLPAGQEWFAVFMRVENETGRPQRAATDYTITDTQDTKFKPLNLAPENVFAYRGDPVGANGGLLPVPDSPAAETTVQGALLLFKIPTRNLENRPLELSIRAGETATVDLDI
jgi:hypothetical protein